MLTELKRVSPFPEKQSRDQLLGLGGHTACDSCPAAVGDREGGRSWGHRHSLIFLVLCFIFFTSILFKVSISGKLADAFVSK